MSSGLERSFGPVLLLDDDVFLEHVAPPEHPETGDRLLAIREGLQNAAQRCAVEYVRVPFGDADDAELARVHTAAYIESLGLLAGRSGVLDNDTFVSPGSVAAARRAAGAAVQLVRSLAAGDARTGLALTRPPGHHALADQAMGFCLLNNVAVAAAEARRLGHERVLVLDWDVHHGNGTEAMFYDDPSVLFISLHQSPKYPGTGAATDVGSGEGRGATVNLPLPEGATNAVYRAAFERVVLPIVEQFGPTFTLVSCGFDAHGLDPLAEMNLTGEGFEFMATALLRAVPASCPVGVLLEGGYDLTALTEASESVAKALFENGTTGASRSSTDVSARHAAALQQAAAAQRAFWKLD